jgi:hypothetical protein
MDAVAVMKAAALVALCCALVVARPRDLDAHPIHTTLTVLTPDAAGRALTLSIRTFADDFSASVARFERRPVPRDSSVAAEGVARYVRARVHVSDASGASATLVSCGVKRTRELYWLCFTAALPRGVRGARINNQMLTELHADQVNIVQLESAGSRKSYLFTRESQAGVLAP